jgi:hypothetical protein
MNKSAWNAIMVLAMLALPGVAREMTPFVPKLQLGGDLHVDRMREQNLNVVKKAVEGIGKTLPQKVDAYTTLMGIDSNGTRLIYTFEVDGGPKSDATLRQEGESRMAPIVRKGICQSAARFLQAGIDISYRYRSKATGKEILRVDVNEKDCRRSR